jgi:glycosyltransferase involved in cell wall biosynthesis
VPGTSRQLRIAHIDTIPEWRGGQEALLTLACGLEARGHRQWIVCPPDSELGRRARAAGMPVSNSGGVLTLRRILRDVDVVHAHTGHAQTRVAIAAWGLRIARVVTRHTSFQPRNTFFHRLKYGHTLDRIIAVSSAVRDALLRSGIPEEMIEVIHTGVALPANPPDEAQRKAARAALGLAGDDFVIGHLGGFTREKGQDIAARAAEILKQRLPGARMVLAGEGPLLPEVRRAAGGAGVLFPGFVADRESFYAALDVFIMPSRSEAWGLAALDAMARGVPVIASKVGGLPEMIGNAGWLVPPESPQDLAEAIFQAERNRADLRAAGQAARRQAALFSREETIGRTESVYLRLVNR